MGKQEWCELSPWDGSQQWVVNPCVTWPNGTVVIIRLHELLHGTVVNPGVSWPFKDSGQLEYESTLWDSDPPMDELTLWGSGRLWV